MRAFYTIVALGLFFGFLVWFFMPRTQEFPSPIACTMDAKICPDGTAVGRTGPNCEFAECPLIEETGIADDLIVITTPLPDAVVTSPIMVSGQARGTWFFEGSFPIVVVNWNGLIIGEGYATAQDEWMTTEFVPFTGTISYTIPPETPYNRGFMIFKKDNPSGLPEHDDAREFQIFFSEIESI